MKQAPVILIVVAVFAGLVLIGGVFYTVNETQQVVMTRFGKPVGNAVTEAGLHVKLPFVHKPNYFEKRYLEWDGDPNEIPTKDKRFIFVDTYARWRITDPLLYFQRLRDERGAQSRLDDILDGETRNTIAKHNLIAVVRSSDREFAADELSEDVLDAQSHQAGGEQPTEQEPTAAEETAAGEEGTEAWVGRAALEKEVFNAATKRVADAELGIEILDFRFKRINYVETDRREVYNRMISERQRIAEEFRSQGAGERARINGKRERELKEITSDAYRQAQEIRGRADAEAADIYAAAYNKDPEFYRFMKTMEVYRETVDDKTVLLLGTDGEFLKYLNSSR